MTHDLFLLLYTHTKTKRLKQTNDRENIMKVTKLIAGFYRVENEYGVVDFEIININTLMKINPEWALDYELAKEEFKGQKGWVYVHTASSYQASDFHYETSKADCIQAIKDMED